MKTYSVSETALKGFISDFVHIPDVAVIDTGIVSKVSRSFKLAHLLT